MSNDKEFDPILGFSENMWAHLIDDPGNFVVPTRRAPAAKQLERVWSLNNAEPHNNYISNSGSGGTSYKVTDSPAIPLKEYENMYFKMFMKDSESPFKVASIAKEKLSEEERKATASVFNAISAESPLLGSYYVVAEPFKNCNEANNFFKQNCKTALYIKKMSKCTGCQYNRGSSCGLMGKKLAAEIPYEAAVVNTFVKKAYSERALTKDETLNILNQKNPKERLRNYFRVMAAKKQTHDTDVDSPAPRYTQDNIVKASQQVQQDIKVARVVVDKLVANGVSEKDIIQKVGSLIGTPAVKEIIPQALRSLKGPLNTYKFAKCDDSLIGNVALLKKDAACSDCVFYAGSSCSKFKTSFIQESQDPVIISLGERIKEARAKNENYLNAFFVKCVDSGVSYNQLKQAFEINIGLSELNGLLKGSLKQASKLDPYRFSRCKGSFYENVEQIHMGSGCNGCSFNAGSHCSKLKKAFNNPAQTPHMYAPDVPTGETPLVMKAPELSKEARMVVAKYKEGGNFAVCVNTLKKASLSTPTIKKALYDAVKSMDTLDAVRWNGCQDSDIVKQAKYLVKTSSCGSCIMNGGSRCNKFKVAFSAGEANDEVFDESQLLSEGDGEFEVRF